MLAGQSPFYLSNVFNFRYHLLRRFLMFRKTCVCLCVCVLGGGGGGGGVCVCVGGGDCADTSIYNLKVLLL